MINFTRTIILGITLHQSVIWNHLNKTSIKLGQGVVTLNKLRSVNFISMTCKYLLCSYPFTHKLKLYYTDRLMENFKAMIKLQKKQFKLLVMHHVMLTQTLCSSVQTPEIHNTQNNWIKNFCPETSQFIQLLLSFYQIIIMPSTLNNLVIHITKLRFK